MPVRSRALLFVAAVGLALTVSACGTSTASPPTAKGTAPPPPVTTTTAQAITTPTVTIGGKTYTVPTDGDSATITPFSDSGQQIVLAASGALPRTLYSALKTPVVFTNLTAHPLTLTIKDAGIPPATIVSGGTFSYTPTVLAFAYTASNGAAGIVNVDAFGQQ
jgi:hypothetical protein